MVKTLRSPKLQKKHNLLLALNISLIILTVVFLIGAPAFLTHAKFMSIERVDVKGSSVVSSIDIERIVRDHIGGNYLKIFSKGNILLYPKKEISQSIERAFGRLSGVSITTTSLTSVSVSVSERKPSALWCKTDAGKKAGCYFLDTKGLIFDTAPDFSPNVYFIYFGNIEGDPIGKVFTDPDSFSKISSLIAGMKDQNLNPISISLVEGDSYQATLKSGGEIVFSLKDSPEKILSNLESVLSDPTLRIMQNGVFSAKSLDLRYGNKVIIKK